MSKRVANRQLVPDVVVEFAKNIAKLVDFPELGVNEIIVAPFRVGVVVAQGSAKVKTEHEVRKVYTSTETSG